MTSKKKTGNSSESVAASFVCDNQSLHDRRNSLIRAKLCVAEPNKHSCEMTKKRLKIDNETTFAKSTIRSSSYTLIKKGNYSKIQIQYKTNLLLFANHQNTRLMNVLVDKHLEVFVIC